MPHPKRNNISDKHMTNKLNDLHSKACDVPAGSIFILCLKRFWKVETLSWIDLKKKFEP